MILYIYIIILIIVVIYIICKNEIYKLLYILYKQIYNKEIQYITYIEKKKI
jgi:hypothetical protein